MPNGEERRQDDEVKVETNRHNSLGGAGYSSQRARGGGVYGKKQKKRIKTDGRSNLNAETGRAKCAGIGLPERPEQKQSTVSHL